jgi:hypothetical protein
MLCKYIPASYHALEEPKLHNEAGNMSSLLNCSSFWLVLIVVVVPSIGIYLLGKEALYLDLKRRLLSFSGKRAIS